MKRQVPGTIVLGDDLPIKSRLIGWWAKLEIFSPWYANLRPCILLDLDTYVLDLSILDEFPTTGMWLLNDFNRPQQGESGIVVVPKDTDKIWAKLFSQITQHRGDGPYLATFPHQRLQTAVDGIQSYKVDQLYESPKNARIVCFHGKPKPHECEGWAGKHWNTLISPTKN